MRLAARCFHRLLEELLIELDADLADVARLLAQQIAGAADVEIVAGELESRAQRVEGLHHLEPQPPPRSACSTWGHGEVGVGARLAAADRPRSW